MSFAREEDVNDIPPYPIEWEAHQRVQAYWHAVNFTNLPTTTEGWFVVWKSLEREQQRRQKIIPKETE
jgi:hypothetical protein